MIVKVPKNRRDGRSSFKDLSKYITEGIENQAAPPTTTSWDRLTQYITQESVLDVLGDEVEKTIAVEIGNVTSLATAPAEMYAVAKKNSRAKNPVYHYILSWPEHEKPKTEDIFEAVRHTLGALGMADHQYIAAIHANTDNIHVHVEVNRVHPETYKAVPLGFDHKTLHHAAREVEIRFGWHHDPGLFKVVEVQGRKLIVEDASFVDEDIAKLQGKADAISTWSGEESLQEWCSRVPAAPLRKVLKDPKTASWQDIHRVLLQHGLELRHTGGGGMVIADLSGEATSRGGQPVVVAASKAFRFMKRAELEARLGPFRPPSQEAHQPAPVRTYKRDPQKRLERRLERKALRDDLKARFAAERDRMRALRTRATEALTPHFANDKRRLAAIDTQYKANRAAIQTDRSIAGPQKQQAYMLLKLTTDKARVQLRESIEREREMRKSLLPLVPTWRAWVEEQAKLGDEAAISALRGMVYQEGRDRKRALGEGGNVDDEPGVDDQIPEHKGAPEENAIRPVGIQAVDPYVRAVSNLIWRVSNNGKVHYSFDGGTQAFVDEGDRVTYGRREVAEDALMLSLRYAASKWPDGVRLTGGDVEFKKRAVRAATELGIRIANIELQALQQSMRDELSAVQRQNAMRHGQGSAIKAVEDQMRGIDPKAKLSYVAGPSARYQGRIVAQTESHVVQHVGHHDYVVHDKTAMRKSPRTGEEVTISYRAGRPVVTRPNSVQRGR